MVAKLAHANPLTVLRTIIHQVCVSFRFSFSFAIKACNLCFRGTHYCCRRLRPIGIWLLQLWMHSNIWHRYGLPSISRYFVVCTQHAPNDPKFRFWSWLQFWSRYGKIILIRNRVPYRLENAVWPTQKPFRCSRFVTFRPHFGSIVCAFMWCHEYYCLLLVPLAHLKSKIEKVWDNEQCDSEIQLV